MKCWPPSVALHSFWGVPRFQSGDGKRNSICRGVSDASQQSVHFPGPRFCACFFLLHPSPPQGRRRRRGRRGRQCHGQLHSGCRHFAGKSVDPVFQSFRQQRCTHSHQRNCADPYARQPGRRAHAPAIRYRFPRHSFECAFGELYRKGGVFESRDHLL